MTVNVVEIEDISVQIEQADVWNTLGSRDRVVPALQEELEQQLTLGESLCSPRGLYTRLGVDEVGRGGVTFENGLRLEGSFLAHLFTGAQEAIFLIATIGPALEEHVSQMFGEGDTVEAVVLDAVGSAAIMNVFEHILHQIYEDTEARSWSTGTCLRPGQSYWDITGQQSIFDVVPGDSIGVEILDSAFMRPQKSQSAVVPIGPDLRVHGNPDESCCRYCQAKNCPMRSEPQQIFGSS